jgi:hypothetical protein
MCQSLQDERTVPVAVGGRGNLSAGSLVHKTLNREQRRGSCKRAAREMSVGGAGLECTGGMEGLKKMSTKLFTGVKQRVPS